MAGASAIQTLYGKRAVNWLLIVSGLVGAAMLALGCGFIVPLSNVMGGLCDLAAIASGMFFFGLLDGE